MTATHILGFPRMGADRELKRSLEAYWAGKLSQQALIDTGRALRARHWLLQRAAGLSWVTVGDFSYYDHVLDTSALFGVVPERFDWRGESVDLDTYFSMARGAAPGRPAVVACEMTKWFDTNYHYLVPEFAPDQIFRIASSKLFDEVDEALAQQHRVKPVLLGPLSYLWLGKMKSDCDTDRLSLLDRLLPCYREVLARLAAQGVDWVQVDEPILGLDLPDTWRAAFPAAYQQLAAMPVKLLLTSYFEGLGEQRDMVCRLPVAGLHIDVVRAPSQLEAVVQELPRDTWLSLGVIDGRNIWRADLDAWLKTLAPIKAKLGERLMLGSSCSLLHVPVDVERETRVDSEIRPWLAFALQKLKELSILARVLDEGAAPVAPELAAARSAVQARRASPLVQRPMVRGRLAQFSAQDLRRQRPFAERRAVQRAMLKLPSFPTTTIGSFPQTREIRAARRAFKVGTLSESAYQAKMQEEIRLAVHKQEAIGLDVLVHGEAERNDMVEYFGEQLAGFTITEHGWVQSYGSRCVKPPILFGDVERPQPMTVAWTSYAQSLTAKPMKGMLTGPVTILKWSFVRDDQALAETAKQIALAIRDEVLDLERAGIRVIQIDEPALREALPLKTSQHPAYLRWAVDAFRLAASGVADATQIHTHMCYAEFNDIIDAVAELDADVITIETSRSDMELLDAFVGFRYPNEIGPGVYDIHSPRVPETGEMLRLLRKASEVLPAEHLWVNPDCGLKTRNWPEVEQALSNMVAAAHRLRAAATPPA